MKRGKHVNRKRETISPVTRHDPSLRHNANSRDHYVNRSAPAERMCPAIFQSSTRIENVQKLRRAKLDLYFMHGRSNLSDHAARQSQREEDTYQNSVHVFPPSLVRYPAA